MSEKDLKKIIELFNVPKERLVTLQFDISGKMGKIALVEAMIDTPFKYLLLKNIHYFLKENYGKIRSIPFLTNKEKELYDKFMKDPDLYIEYFDYLIDEYREQMDEGEESRGENNGG